MKKIYILFIIVLIILFLFNFINVSFAKVYNSLSDFINNYGIKDMSSAQKTAKIEELQRQLEDYNEMTGTTIKQNVASILEDVNNISDSKEKRKRLEEEFSAQANLAMDDTSLDYLYYGYMLGEAWINSKSNEEEENKNTEDGKTIAQQFDEKYNEYKSLKDDERDIDTLNKYKDSLWSLWNKLPKEDQTDERYLKYDEVDTECIQKDDSALDVPDTIYKYPSKEDNLKAGSLDDMIGDADSFISKANDKDDVISSESLQNFSQTFYNILLTVGIIVAVLVGLVIGIKFMIGGAEERANIKEILLPYIAGCMIVFGAFAIWKIVVIVLQRV